MTTAVEELVRETYRLLLLLALSHNEAMILLWKIERKWANSGCSRLDEMRRTLHAMEKAPR